MKIRNGTQSSRMRSSETPLSDGSWRTCTSCLSSSGCSSSSPETGITLRSGVPSFSLPVTVVGRLALSVTLCTLLFCTCCLNSEYGMSCAALPRGLKLWNTVNSTTAMINQSSTFLAMSFIGLSLSRPAIQPRRPVASA
uniref:Uncharacterized protein n=1 Tax=Mizugakiibacter sediminis TaxID=1475481 RepID=A0A0S6YXB9_9GAMM